MEDVRVRLRSRTERQKHYVPPKDGGNDDDVLAEMRLVDRLSDEDIKGRKEYDVVWKHLRKVFLKKQKSSYNGLQGVLEECVAPKVEYEAVHDVSLAIPAGQCFGLLGPNGAGKTTTLEMVTAEIVPTTGFAYTAGYGILLFTLKEDISKTSGDLYGKVVGYCPQFDALPEFLTGHELLIMYAQIKGYDYHDASEMALHLAQQLGITEFADKLTQAYSGGTKRKLSICISLTGQPKVVYLDEPSAGIDPLTRRHLWDTIEKRRGLQTTILTTHSMEEAEHLCSRLCIIVKGSVQCIGSAQHLKQNYGKGYYVEVKGVENNSENINNMILGIYPDAVVYEQFNGHYRYHIPNRTISLGTGMIALQKLVESKYLTHYSLSIPSLEQIFITFAKNQDRE